MTTTNAARNTTTLFSWLLVPCNMSYYIFAYISQTSQSFLWKTLPEAVPSWCALIYPLFPCGQPFVLGFNFMQVIDSLWVSSYRSFCFFFCQIMLRINPLKYIFGKKMNFSFIVRCLSLEDFRALGVVAIMLFEEIIPSSCHQHF